jgi:hypothetical protein
MRLDYNVSFNFFIMNKKWFFTLFVAVFLYGTAFSQPFDSKQYIYLSTDYKFCFDMPDMMISVPSHWGFKVSHLKGEEARLTLTEHNVSYSMPYNGTITVNFVQPESQIPCLEVSITSYDEEQQNDGISSDFGTFQRIYAPDQKQEEVYQYGSYSRMVSFRILAESETDKQLCRDIISSAKACYSDYNNGLESNQIHYYAKDSTVYPSLGFTFITPMDINATLLANECIINQATTLLTAIGTLQELSGTQAGYFYNDNFDMEYRFYDKSDYIIHNVIEEKTDDYADCMQSFTYPVSGIPSEFYVINGTITQSVLCMIPANDYWALFTFNNVNADNVDHLVQIIAQISIDTAFCSYVGLPAVQKDILKDKLGIRTFDEAQLFSPIQTLTFNASAKKYFTIVCDMPTINAKLFIPAFEGEANVYPHNDTHAMPLNKKHKKLSVTLTPIPNDSDDYDNYSGSYAIVAQDPSEENYCICWIAETEATTAMGYASNLLSQFAVNDCNASDVTLRASVQINGKTWYVIKSVYYGDTLGFYITEHKGKIIEVRSKVANEEYFDFNNVVESFLYKAVF